jgi:hypothetical protein
MGLDMYAYTLDKDLVSDEWKVDVPVHIIAQATVGFEHLSEEEQKTLDSVKAADYYSKQYDALRKAEERGLLTAILPIGANSITCTAGWNGCTAVKAEPIPRSTVSPCA